MPSVAVIRRDRAPFRPDRAQVETWVESRLDVRHRGSEEWTCVCPFHQDSMTTKPDLYVNVEKGVYLCMSASCGARGGILSLVSRVDGVDPDAVRAALSLTGRGRVEQVRDRLRRALLPPPSLPTISQARIDELRSDRYWAERGYDGATIERFELGYDPESERAIIPFRDPEGVCRWLIGRATRPGQEPRYLYPTSFPERSAVYNLHAIDPRQEVAVVEGTTDAHAVYQAGWPNVVATMGSNVLDEQLVFLRPLRLVSMFDRDSAGAAATRRLLYNHPRAFRVARYPAGLPAIVKDPGELEGPAILAALEGAIPSLTWARMLVAPRFSTR